MLGVETDSVTGVRDEMVFSDGSAFLLHAAIRAHTAVKDNITFFIRNRLLVDDKIKSNHLLPAFGVGWFVCKRSKTNVGGCNGSLKTGRFG